MTTPDMQRIALLGGPVALAARLKLGKHGASVVTHWRHRGIPAAMKVRHPELFMVPIAALKKALKGEK